METYTQLEESNPDMDAASTAAHFEAYQLLGMADEMEARVAADGLMIEGCSGQLVPHGLISDIRPARTQATATLRALGVAPGQSVASMAGTALVG